MLSALRSVTRTFEMESEDAHSLLPSNDGVAQSAHVPEPQKADSQRGPKPEGNQVSGEASKGPVIESLSSSGPKSSNQKGESQLQRAAQYLREGWNWVGRVVERIRMICLHEARIALVHISSPRSPRQPNGLGRQTHLKVASLSRFEPVSPGSSSLRPLERVIRPLAKAPEEEGNSAHSGHVEGKYEGWQSPCSLHSRLSRHPQLSLSPEELWEMECGKLTKDLESRDCPGVGSSPCCAT